VYDNETLSIFRKILELEEELKVVGNNLKSLEVSEEKVKRLYNNCMYGANSISYIMCLLSLLL